MTVAKHRVIAYFLFVVVFIQLFGIVNIASVKTNNSELNIGISEVGVSLAPPVNKPVYFGEKQEDFSVVLYAVLINLIGGIRQRVSSSFDVYKDVYPVISRLIFEVFRE